MTSTFLIQVCLSRSYDVISQCGISSITIHLLLQHYWNMICSFIANTPYERITIYLTDGLFKVFRQGMKDIVEH